MKIIGLKKSLAERADCKKTKCSVNCYHISSCELFLYVFIYLLQVKRNKSEKTAVGQFSTTDVSTQQITITATTQLNHTLSHLEKVP